MKQHLELAFVFGFLVLSLCGFVYLMGELATVKTNVETIICDVNEC